MTDWTKDPDGYAIEIAMLELPNSNFYKLVDGVYIFDNETATIETIKEIRNCRDCCWQKLDGLYLGYERDVNTSMVADCEILRQSIKDVPENAQIACDSAVTMEDFELITFKSLLTIPDSLVDICDCYFD